MTAGAVKRYIVSHTDTLRTAATTHRAGVLALKLLHLFEGELAEQGRTP